MKRILFLNLLLIAFVTNISAQNVFDPNDPIVRYSSGAVYGSAQKPDSNIVGLQKWVSIATSGVSSGSGNFATLAATFKSYFINYYNNRLTFRLKFPNSYNNPDSANKKYPVALFMHGAGEVACLSNGGIYNNEKQLVIGGKTFAQRVDNNSFDGFLLYPQLRALDNGCWGEWRSGPNANYNTIITIIDSMVKYIRADMDRVFVFGLSGGGLATWELAENYSTRIAKIAPTSAAGVPLIWNNLIHIPIWLATGGKDTNPTPVMAEYTYNNINSLGGDMRKSLYADLGHASWDRHWAEPDFVPYMNDVHKANPLIFFNRFEFCPTDPVSAKLGITAGFYSYEWREGNTLIATSYGVGNPANNVRTNTVLNNSVISSFGSGGNEITVKAFGTYSVRFRRTPTGDWSEWSPKPAVISPKTITQTPSPQIVGMYSRVLPALDGRTKVQLQLPDGFLDYQWVRTSDNVTVSNSRLYDAPVGSYKARYSEPYGCGTEFSPVFNVVNATGSPKPDAAKNLSVNAVSQTALRLDWSDNANAGTNETGFEIYRATDAGGPYALINITAPDVVTFQDNGLTPNTTYYYLVRAISETGAAAASNEANGKTEIDNMPPSAPSDLEYRGSTSTTVSLRWKAANDNAAIARYDIYANGQKLYSTTNLSFIVANLDSLTTYTFYVKAVDKAGNASPNSNQVTGYTHRQGLNYRYYTGSFGNNVPNFDNYSPVKTGIMDTVTSGVGVRTQEDNFAFLWEGKVYIPVSGTWTFETESDDGSKLYLDVPYSHGATALVSNDGAHGAQIRTGSKYLTAGYHTIAISFAEIGGDATMNLYWSNNVGLARERIPKRFFSIGDSYDAIAVSAPSSFSATATAYNEIILNWTDNSNNESGFEIIRSTSLNGTYVPIATTAANAVSYTDSGLTAATRYFYKLRAVAPDGASDYTNSFGEANWKFNNNYSEANGGPGLSNSNTSFNNSDKAEGSHSVSFNSSDYISMGGNNTTFPSMGGYSQRTVALWIKPSSTNSRRMIFEMGGSDNGLGLRFNSDDLEAGVASGSSLYIARLSNFTGNGNWLSGQWNHVAVVYDVNALRLYLNGVLVASNTSLSFTSIGNSNNVSRIGNPSGNGSANVFNDGSTFSPYTTYSGLMDNMYVVRGALSAGDLLELRNNDVLKTSSATTLAAPPAPAVPNGIIATVLSTNSIRVAFNDNTTDETGFEIWRASGDKTNNRKIATVSAGNGGQIIFTDSSLFANTTYYYTVRATGLTANSAFSAEVNGKTLNTKPVITKIMDFSMKYGTTFVLPVKAVDADGEVLNFSTVNLPAFATLQPVSNGNMNISFSPGTRQRGTYTISIIVQDLNNGKDTAKFLLTVNTNDVPVMSAVQPSIMMKEGDRLTIPVSATDNNGTAFMVWSFTNLPPFVTFTNNNNGTGSLALTPGYATSGEYEMTIMVDDGYGAWTSRTIAISVQEREPDELVQFDFRATSPEVAGWNSVNVVPPGFNHGAVYSVKGNLSDIALTLMKGSVAFSTNGPSTGSNTGVFPDAVLKDNMTWGWNTTDNLNDTVIVKVTGLNQYNTYDFTFNGSANMYAVVKYDIGNQRVSYDIANKTTGLTIPGVQPTPQGEVLITMIGEGSLTRGGAISGLVIKSTFNDGSTPAKPTNVAGVHTLNSGVRVTWLDKAYNENAYQVYRSNVKAGPYTLLNPGASNRDSSGYNDPTIAPETTYYYYVVGINGVGTGTPSDTIKVITGNNAPVVVLAANIYAKTDATENVDFTVTDDPGDMVTVTLAEKPNFVSLQSLGGSNYRIVVNPLTDHIGWYTIKLRAVDNKGAEVEKTIALTVSDKNTRSVFINFGSATATAPAPWNNWLGTKATGNFLDALKDERNTATTFRVTASNTWTVLNDMGHITGNNSGVVPDAVLASGLIDNTSPRIFTITGLNNSKKYNIVFIGSMNEGTSGNVEYSSGTVLDTLNARYNTNLTANLNGLTPSAGQITVSARRMAPSETNYLNAMIIEEYDPSITILNPLNLKAEPFDRNSIDLSWSDRTRDEATAGGYVLERATDSLFTLNTVAIALPANTTVYRNTGLSANTKYWYRLRSKTAGGMFSDYSNRAKAITPAAIVYVDFNYTLPVAEYPWNTFESPSIQGGLLDSMISTTGAVSGLSLEMTRVFNGEFTAGVNTGTNSGIVSDKTLASNYWLDKTQLSQFRLTGLNHSRKYRIGFFGSSSSAGWFKGNYTATYTINGRTVYLNSWMNSSKIVYIDNVVPDEAGGVDLDFSTTEAAMYGFNSGIIIQDYTDPDNVNNFVMNNSMLVDDEEGVAANNASNEVLVARASSADGRLYPNPFTDFVNIDFENTSADNNISVEVYDLSGRIGYRKQLGKLPQGSNTVRIGAADAGMKMGVYIITLSVNGRPLQANKVIRTGN